ncbi:FG-GAP-like repeat-containing protein [Actinacidiphila rubida]|uniref:Repeat domain-containing protein n=1 Tax=Actinacidiphila rubida TaxID=310780 RepID=A0A1H8E453_9ACTN|nr:FG-GAP-like repeat-containing protein [Actinacidiphila rubida]SEN14220.1 Repeat domain-containing protein [Actinacidiphila rubida]
MRTVRSAAVGAVLGLAAATGLAAVSAPQASASTSVTSPVARCPKGKLCLFDGLDGTGAVVGYTGSQMSLGTWADRARSYVDRTGYTYFCPNRSAQYADPEKWVMSGNDAVVNLNGLDVDRHVRSFLLTSSRRECETGVEYFTWRSDDASVTRAAKPFGDLNGDGHTDLLFRSPAGRLWFLKGDGKGTLIGGGWNAMTALTRHGDLDGNGTEDLLARDTAGVLWFYPGNGRGAFGARVRIGAGWNTMKRITAAGDLDGDGRGDLLARDSAGVLWRYPGNGRGAFGARSRIGAGWNMYTFLLAPGDADGDGTNDLYGFAPDAYVFYSGLGNGLFQKVYGDVGLERTDTAY